jgi:hypothetical protein
MFGLAASVAGNVGAASTNPRAVDSPSVSTRITQYCDPVCELRAQDSAFSLLIEAYRQFQARQIELDYEARLRAATGLGKEADSLVIDTTLNSTRTLRAWIEVLAEKERELRLEQLQTRVVNFTTAYHCSRKGDEQAIEQPVAIQVDPEAAARQLRTLRVLALGSPVRADFQTVKSTSAADVFLDSPPAEAWPQEIIGPCDDAPNSAPVAQPAH